MTIGQNCALDGGGLYTYDNRMYLHGVERKDEERKYNVIYLDNGATTKLSERSLDAMMPYLTEEYGNSYGVYGMGRNAMQAVEKARSQVARLINVHPREIYFTSGGTESDNWAVRLAALTSTGNSEKGHLIASAVEHPAVLRSLEAMEEQGWQVTRILPDENGRIDPSAVKEAVRPDTKLITVMTANNEIGTLEPVREIGEIAREAGILFHSDAVQAVGHIPLDGRELGVDLLSASGHKFGGPKGVGFLYVRQGTKLVPFMTGGGQERQMRAGTHNVPGIVGMGEAAAQCMEEMEHRIVRETGLRDRFIRAVTENIPGVRLNGPEKDRLPGNVNFTVDGVNSEALLFRLDRQGVCASAGSACSAGAMEPSHVLTAIGRTREEAFSSVRFTLSWRNTREEMDRAVQILREAVEEIRRADEAFGTFGRKD